MKTAVLAALLAFAFPLAAYAADNDLHGTWKLTNLTRKSADGKVEEPRGKAPKGYLHLGADGRMMSVIVNEQRPKPASVQKMTDQERIALFNSMNAYAGTYKLAGNKLTYQFDVVHNEVPERAAVREIKLDGRRLTMTNEVAASTMDGAIAQTITVWEKVGPPQQ
jgi:lipocalin-like protein